MNSATPMNTATQIVEKERTHRRIFLHAVPGTGTGCTLVTQPRRARNRHARIWGHPTRLPSGPKVAVRLGCRPIAKASQPSRDTAGLCRNQSGKSRVRYAEHGLMACDPDKK